MRRFNSESLKFKQKKSTYLTNIRFGLVFRVVTVENGGSKFKITSERNWISTKIQMFCVEKELANILNLIDLRNLQLLSQKFWVSTLD
jgi:hypothetical protein